MTQWIITSSVLIVIVTALRYLLKGKVSLRLQYALWGLVLIRLLIPFSLGESKFSVMNAVEQSSIYQNAANIVTTVQVPSDILRDSDLTIEEAEAVGRGTLHRVEGYPVESGRDHLHTYSFQDSLKEVASRLLRVVWICGAILTALVMLGSNLYFALRLRRSRVWIEEHISPAPPIPVYLSQVIETPCLFGFFSPAIYLTPEVYSDEKAADHVVAHETTHFRHGDHIWSLLRCICLALHWYNPLVWLAASLSRRDGELACDESTIKYIGEAERADYGRTLIGLTCTGRGAILTTATTMTGSKRSIKERIQLIAKKPKTAVYTLIAVLVIACLAIGCTFTDGGEDRPWTWANNLSAEDVDETIFWTGSSTYSLSTEETQELVHLINELNRFDFKENAELAGSTPTSGLSIVCENKTYHINDGGRLEIKYEEKQWWITDETLSEFVKNLLEEHSIQPEPSVVASSSDLTLLESDHSDCISVILHRAYAPTSQSSGIYVKVIAYLRENSSTLSGFEIADIEIPAIVDQVGYAMVRTKDYSPQIKQIGFDLARQTMQVGFEFQSKVDAGSLNWLPQQTSLKISLKEKVEGAEVLSMDEIARVNESLVSFFDNGNGGMVMNPLGCFFTSYFEQPESIDLNSFLAYFPSNEPATEAEFEALKELDGFRFSSDSSLSSIPVPVRRISVSSINDVLERYAGTNLSNFSSSALNGEDLLYLEEYDAYYTYTSDAIGVGFQCIYGEKMGEYLNLYSTSGTLTLRQNKHGYLIQSYLPTDLLQTS